MKILLLAIFVALSTSVFAAETGARHSEPTGGFSYQYPGDWSVQPYENMKYKMAFGPSNGQFAPNINFMDQQFDGTMEQYSALASQSLQQMLKLEAAPKMEAFQTDSGLKGYSYNYKYTENNVTVDQHGYILQKADKLFYVLTCTHLPEQKDVPATCSSIAKSFKFDN